MNKINWGIIGCGDVTEIKSGPAFNKVNGSALVAVMRRDAIKAQDYAKRHNVPKWYSNAEDIIKDPEVNAIYIATPPSSHTEYAYAAIAAGKPVYVEKPMALNSIEASKMTAFAKERNVKLVVAHYRRSQPLFRKVKELIDNRVVGDIRIARMELYRKPLSVDPVTLWRLDPSVSGGGLFHDLAPHQLDLMYYYFGKVKRVEGIAANQAGAYNADDIVSGNILFDCGALFSGVWCFNVNADDECDKCEMTGSAGKIEFSIFEGHTVTVTINGKKDIYSFDPILHVQQPMIQEVVKYFSGCGDSPCPAEDGVAVMKLMDALTAKKYL